MRRWLSEIESHWDEVGFGPRNDQLKGQKAFTWTIIKEAIQQDLPIMLPIPYYWYRIITIPVVADLQKFFWTVLWFCCATSLPTVVADVTASLEEQLKLSDDFWGVCNNLVIISKWRFAWHMVEALQVTAIAQTMPLWWSSLIGISSSIIFYDWTVLLSTMSAQKVMRIVNALSSYKVVA